MRVFAFVSMFLVCGLKVIFLTYVTPIGVGVSVLGMGMLLSVIVGCRLYSSAWGVIRVNLDFVGEIFILFE